jgi:hypothetical protein
MHVKNVNLMRHINRFNHGTSRTHHAQNGRKHYGSHHFEMAEETR